MGDHINVFKGSKNQSVQGYRSQIPTSDSLGSEWMKHKPSVIEYSPPALTNQWAMVQASRDITAYDDFSVSPVRCGEGKFTELFFGFSKDDFLSCEQMDTPVSYQWFPHMVKRKAEINGLDVTSEMTLAPTRDVLQMKINMQNTTEKPISFALFIKTLTGLNCSSSRVVYDKENRAFQCYDLTDQNAFMIQSVDTKPDGYGTFMNWEKWYHAAMYRHYNKETIVHGEESEYASYGAFYYDLNIEPGAFWQVSFIHAMGENEENVRDQFQYVKAHFGDEMKHSERQWDEEIRSAFTPGNSRFSGHFPVIDASDTNLKRLYDMSAVTLLLSKRTRRMGEPAKVYSSGMTGWVHCFLWDGQMSASALSILDPVVLKKMIEHWIKKDPSTYMATNYVTGEGEAVWYAINDFAMFFTIQNYLSHTGDIEWLDKKIQGKTMMEYFEQFGTAFMDHMEDDSLVNYGNSRNLLECVFSYQYKVPAFNATNVWMLRKLSELLTRQGKAEKADRYLQISQKIADSVMSLYEKGKGYFNCKYPDESLVPVKTCLDFNYIFQVMDEEMSDEMKNEMIQFFVDELQTDTWMHALSPNDPDTSNSMRTDHQDDGAYISWPAFGLMGMLRAGRIDEALNWIGVGGETGIATVTRQGPWGQAYFHGGKNSLLEFDSAMKAPKEYPYIERYVAMSGSMFLYVIIEELFRLRADWDGLKTPHQVLEQPFEKAMVKEEGYANLYNLTIQGETYHAHLPIRRGKHAFAK